MQAGRASHGSHALWQLSRRWSTLCSLRTFSHAAQQPASPAAPVVSQLLTEYLLSSTGEAADPSHASPRGTGPLLRGPRASSAVGDTSRSSAAGAYSLESQMRGLFPLPSSRSAAQQAFLERREVLRPLPAGSEGEGEGSAREEPSLEGEAEGQPPGTEAGVVKKKRTWNRRKQKEPLPAAVELQCQACHSMFWRPSGPGRPLKHVFCNPCKAAEEARLAIFRVERERKLEVRRQEELEEQRNWLGPMSGPCLNPKCDNIVTVENTPRPQLVCGSCKPTTFNFPGKCTECSRKCTGKYYRGNLRLICRNCLPQAKRKDKKLSRDALSEYVARKVWHAGAQDLESTSKDEYTEPDEEEELLEEAAILPAAALAPKGTVASTRAAARKKAGGKKVAKGMNPPKAPKEGTAGRVAGKAGSVKSYLRKLKISDKEVSRILGERCPQLAKEPVAGTGLAARVAYLTGKGIQGEELVSLLKKQPQVLTVPLQAQASAFRFVERELQGSVKDVLREPELLTRPLAELEKRLALARHQRVFLQTSSQGFEEWKAFQEQAPSQGATQSPLLLHDFVTAPESRFLEAVGLSRAEAAKLHKAWLEDREVLGGQAAKQAQQMNI